MKLIQNKVIDKDKLHAIDELPPEQDNQIYQAVCVECELVTNMLIKQMLSNRDYNQCPECSCELTFYKIKE